MYSFELSPDELGDRLVVPLYRARHVIDGLAASGKFPVEALGSFAQIASGTYVRGYAASGSTYLRVDNVREYVVNLNEEDTVFVASDARGITSRTMLREGDVLISRTGTLGKASLATKELAGAVLSQHLTRLTLPKSGWSPGYVAAFLNSPLGKVQLLYSGYGSTRQELTHSALRGVRVVKAPSRLQRKIHELVTRGADLLYDSIGRYRRAVAQVESALGLVSSRPTGKQTFEIPSGQLHDLWTAEFYRPAYVKLVRSLERDYVCARLGDIASIQRGRGTRVSDYATVGVPFIRTTSLINFGLDPFPDHYATDEVHSLYDQPVRKGDLLFSMEGKIGQAAFLTDTDMCVFKNHIELVRCNDGVDPMLVFLVLCGVVGQWQARKLTVIQATLPGMANRLREVLVPLRPRADDRLGEWQQLAGAAVRTGYEAARLREESTRALREATTLLEAELAAASDEPGSSAPA